MDDDVNVVQQDPLGVPVAFDMVGSETLLLQLEFDLIGDGLDLTRRLPGAQDEVVGKGCDLFAGGTGSNQECGKRFILRIVLTKKYLLRQTGRNPELEISPPIRVQSSYKKNR